MMGYPCCGVTVIDDRENPARLAKILHVEIGYLGADKVLELVATELRSLAEIRDGEVAAAMVRNAERIELIALE